MAFTEQVKKEEDQRLEQLQRVLHQTEIECADNHPIVLDFLKSSISESSKPVKKTFKGKLNGNDVTIKVYPVKEENIAYGHWKDGKATRKYEMAIELPELNPKTLKELDTRLHAYWENCQKDLLLYYSGQGKSHSSALVLTDFGYIFGDTEKVLNPHSEEGLQAHDHLMFLSLGTKPIIYLDSTLYQQGYSNGMALIDKVLRDGLGLDVTSKTSYKK
jgi:hypothetical protein